MSGVMTTNRCYDPKVMILVELEPAAVAALLDDSYRGLKNWGEWEPRHEARAPLRLVAQSGPDTANVGLRFYCIPMRCEQAEALRDRSEELADILDVMQGQEDRDAGADLKREPALSTKRSELRCPICRLRPGASGHPSRHESGEQAGRVSTSFPALRAARVFGSGR